MLREAEARFEALRLTNVTARAGDGTRGWPQQAPFDRILVAAAAEDIPQVLIDQLGPGGIMVLPVGDQAGRLAAAARLHRVPVEGVIPDLA